MEPVSYWIITGDRITNSNTEQRLAQLHYSLERTVPDGMLVRVSNISTDPVRAYAVHAEFVLAMTRAMSDAALVRIIGAPATN